jgi:LysR family hydrogen peroxide-inducible transcriptional activator
MTIEQLSYVLAVARYQSFVQAATQVAVSQPALTMQVKKLEDELGLLLFDRSRKPLLLTEEGRIFLERAQEVLLGFQDLENLAKELKNREGGDIRLGIIPTLAPYLVPLFINHFREAYPKVRLLISELTTEEIIRDIRHGELDAGIYATPVQSKGMYHEVLFYERFFLYISEPHPWYTKQDFYLKDLPEAGLWMLREGNCFRSQVNDICQLKLHRRPHDQLVYESSSIESLMRIVEHQGGMTLIPELATLAVSPEQENMLRPFHDSKNVREISLAYRQRHHKEKLLKKLKNSILQHIPAHMCEAENREIVDSFVKA